MSFIIRVWQDCKDKLFKKSKVEESEEDSEEEIRDLELVSRGTAAATATGNKKQHERELNRLMISALGEISPERLAEMKAEAEAKAKADAEAQAKATEEAKAKEAKAKEAKANEGKAKEAKSKTEDEKTKPVTAAGSAGDKKPDPKPKDKK